MATLALLAATVAAPSAAADTLVVQPDGKLVLAGRTWFESGAIARLNADGGIDTGFGEQGFSIDHRLPGLQALAIQPDGRILGAAAGGSLARYLPGGAIDPSFGAGGIGGGDEPGEVHFIYPNYGPSDLLVQPGGAIVASGNHSLGDGGTEAWVRRYDSAGGSMASIGAVPQLSGPASSADLEALLEEPGGRIVGAGSSYGYEQSKFVTRPLLGRFPGSGGISFDPSFGGGAGLVRPDSGPFENRADFNGLAAAGTGLLAAGRAGDTVLAARFDSEGVIDQSFGNGGFAAPPVVGPAASFTEGKPRSWAEDVAVTGDGGAVLGGGTEQWSTWVPYQRDIAPHCTACPQPLLVRLDSTGKPDPAFGSGGILHLTRPDGSVLEGAISEVSALADGKVLVNGSLASREPFVARLNQDGSYDASFGDRGLALPKFPCTSEDHATLRRAGCTPAAVVTLRARGLRGRHPSLSLTVKPSLDWAAVHGLNLTLPRGLRPSPKLARRGRAVAVGGSGRPAKLRSYRPRGKKHARSSVIVSGFGVAREVRLKLPAGTLLPLRHGQRRRGALRFPMFVEFAQAVWGNALAPQRLVRRAGG